MDFELSNGKRSTFKQGSSLSDSFDFKKQAKRVARIEMKYTPTILTGLIFYDKAESVIKRVGVTHKKAFFTRSITLDSETETIVGVRCTLHPEYQSCFANFQFVVCKHERL